MDYETEKGDYFLHQAGFIQFNTTAMCINKICNFLIIPFIKFNIKIVKILNLL